MNDLITIPYRYEPGKEPMVSGRTLHERLGIETPFRNTVTKKGRILRRRTRLSIVETGS